MLFQNPHTGRWQMSQELRNTYYHARFTCLTAKHPHFTPSEIELEAVEGSLDLPSLNVLREAIWLDCVTCAHNHMYVCSWMFSLKTDSLCPPRINTRWTQGVSFLLASGASPLSRTMRTIFLFNNYWQAEQANNLVVQCALFFCNNIYLHGRCHTAISNLAINAHNFAQPQ